MYKVLLFAGTTEGRLLAQFLAHRGAQVCACVATEYGKEALEEQTNLTVQAGRLDEAEMAVQIPEFDCVVDATHPYAQEASANIRSACQKTGREYIRVIRGQKDAGSCVFVNSAVEAANYLGTTQGNILLATGSKDLDAYAALPKERLYPRILPVAEAVTHCRTLGIPSKNIICMQGPFSFEMNLATLRQVDAKYIVTKDSGREGGFEEKMRAAKTAHATAVVVGRPSHEAGVTLEAARKLFAGRISSLEQTMFPMFISLAGKNAVVIGGGKIAARRIRTLLDFGCRVHVISPETSGEFSDLLGQISWTQKEYAKGNCNHADLVLAATNNRQVNHSVAEECRVLRIPVSVADCHEECTFYFPAVVRHGRLIAGIISNECDHSAVKHAAQSIRECFERAQDGEGME
jgi:precorrin-6A/cobalt-precorrin-6A reductase